MTNIHLKHSNQNPAFYTDEWGNRHVVEILKFDGDQARVAVWKKGITRDEAEKITVPVSRLKQIRKRS